MILEKNKSDISWGWGIITLCNLLLAYCLTQIATPMKDLFEALGGTIPPSTQIVEMMLSMPWILVVLPSVGWWLTAMRKHRQHETRNMYIIFGYLVWEVCLCIFIIWGLCEPLLYCSFCLK